MRPTIPRSRLPALLAVLLGCTSGPWEPSQYDPAGQSDPQDYEQCSATGGIKDPSFLGDRCILILPQPPGETAYEKCLYRGGVPIDVNFTNRPESPTAAYRCILVFTRSPDPPSRGPLPGSEIHAPDAAKRRVLRGALSM